MASIPSTYKSNAFNFLTSLDFASLNSFYNPHWVAGFTEGDGSFNMVQKGANR